MKLIKKTTLHYQQGSSDKVYEVDLCEITPGSYVVNFRYGKRGANLKEGAKTTKAVTLVKAQQVFDKLVAEKTNKGYQDIAATPTPKKQVKPTLDKEARKQAILNRLADNAPSNWKLSRAIWRAGELKLSEATPLLIKLIGTGEPLRDYCIAWALGWCGGEDAISSLSQLYEDSATAEFVKRMAWEALFKLSEGEVKTTLRSEIVESLSPNLQSLVCQDSSPAIAADIETYLQKCPAQDYVILERMYQIDNQYIRPALLHILRTAPFKPNYFQRLRHIFKMAEYRHDAEVFAILTYRLEQEQHIFSSQAYEVNLPSGERFSRYGYYYDPATGRYRNTNKNQIQEELKSSQSKLAYSNKTRAYLRHRVWRTLKQLGEENDPDYINMAGSILLQYADADAQPIKKSNFFTYDRNWNSIIRGVNWDSYAGYITFNHILYENSGRYELTRNSQGWRCKPGYKPGKQEPDIREEAFPELWQQHPQTLLKLLLASACQPVHHFAVKILRTCQQFCASIDIETIIQLVNKPYEITAQFAFELAQQQYNPQQPNTELILALANCSSEPARNQAYQWITEQREHFLADSYFIANLITSLHSNTRQFTKKLLNSAIINDAVAKVLIGRIIAQLLTIEINGEIIPEIGEILLTSFAPQLRTLGLNVIHDLLAHPSLEIQEIGAKILLNHQTPTEQLPPEVIESLLASPYESLRVIGIRLFGQLPEEKLIGEESILIVAMAVNVNPDIRNAIQPIVHRLAINNPSFSQEIATELIEVLLIPEKHEGVHSHLLHLLKEDLPGWMTSIPKQTTLNLLKAKSGAAQEIGGLILGSNYENWLSEFTTPEIVKLASHEILAVRQAARQMFVQILPRLRTNTQDMVAAVRILEAKWQDSREFGYKIFTTELSSDEFTPEVLITICDSVREEARTLGRDLLNRNFRETDGEEYLLKFSEHPSADMQLFVTNYLEKYATDNPEKLQKLEPLFISILLRVNCGSTAKKRIFTFLETEAQKSEYAAKTIAEIMTRQSATIAITDKSKAIQIMVKIHKQYPHIPLPIAIKSVSQTRN
ncbi:HEAT repeat domain-containing protein [Calothrix rhizosoleniae]|uniref:HEAT repeat domain-containing protein n=1 Tax=Calothrix rhizosoleniae TaxID=888997 RepID=UPI000B49CDDC|nr:HEAT repeat domain-containing protein [Calothrix rhizosoleniae]